MQEYYVSTKYKRCRLHGNEHEYETITSKHDQPVPMPQYNDPLVVLCAQKRWADAPMRSPILIQCLNTCKLRWSQPNV